MRNTSLIITVPHSFSPMSAISAESKSSIIALRFNVHINNDGIVNTIDFSIMNVQWN